MDDKKATKEEATCAGPDKSLRANTNMLNQRTPSACNKLVKWAFGLAWWLCLAGNASAGFTWGYYTVRGNHGCTGSTDLAATVACAYPGLETRITENGTSAQVLLYHNLVGWEWYPVEVFKFVCPPGRLYDAASDTCKAVYDVFNIHHHPSADLCTPNPIQPMTGSKTKEMRTGFVVGAQELTLTYNSINRPNFQLWNTNFHKSLNIQPTQVNVVANRGSGVLYGYPGASLTSNPCGTSTDDGGKGSLSAVSGGASYQYKDETTRAIESYTSAGQLQTIVDAAGHVLTATYSNASTPPAIAPTTGYLLRLTDTDGRFVSFEYTLPAGAVAATGALINKITDTTGNTIGLAYDSNGMLISLTWPDGKARGFVYENAALPWALTGIVDENNSRFQTYDYSASGEATSSELAGGVDRYAVSYQAPMVADSVTEELMGDILCRYHKVDVGGASGMSITKPNGAVSTASMDTSLGYGQLAGLTQPAGSGCAASNNASTFDAQGNVLSQDDFQGQRTCYAYDSRNREITRVEGLANTVDCATVVPDHAVLPANARKITTSWHPDWRIPTVITASGSITTSIYQGQADPFNGNAIANCTSATVLPNGTPLPLICKQVTQATLVNGALDASTVNVVSQFSYDATGRVLASQDTLNRTTSYAYYPDTVINGVPFDDHVSLLLHADGANGSTTFIDSGSSPKSITASGNPIISTASSKYGSASMLFDGILDQIQTSVSTDFSFGAGDFAIEGWINSTAFTNTAPHLISVTDGSGNNEIRLYTSSASKKISALIYHTGAYQFILTGATEMVEGQWYHIAFVRSGNTQLLFLNGILEASATLAHTIPEASWHTRIGWLTGSDAYSHTGYIDEVRITKGLSRYTANFTPPTTAFANPGIVVASPSDTGHTRGDLQSITNALGHVTTFDLFDRAGRIVRSTDSKGVVTTISYTPRGWISSVTVTPVGIAARTTNYTYDDAGQLIGVVQPDGSSLTYTYDAAHRLVGATDAKGNSVNYTLDNVGNRIAEQVKDPSGTLQRSISRSFDALNRLQQVSGAAQ